MAITEWFRCLVFGLRNKTNIKLYFSNPNFQGSYQSIQGQTAWFKQYPLENATKVFKTPSQSIHNLPCLNQLQINRGARKQQQKWKRSWFRYVRKKWPRRDIFSSIHHLNLFPASTKKSWTPNAIGNIIQSILTQDAFLSLLANFSEVKFCRFKLGL